ncbi:uncharacterized protein AMSG_03935 [Thecamonas trahens ATCC 50062]|uniref:Uncharacterized protein n=1 Tax=Thecamonas trahens ATCC 50062 TaxID=461836 RepID=A0A0L0D5S7_THETB|nr:hypothetical protein AMSG_03935 [Thecamonas trahens ATCC 50062]KNC47704.1 hypothetical protein AMSG_03935 [Thecamonas trahens ATCC 50062]|eukprot:XP_013759186.1 hypothetical protein AMSG_03935 [Thecamonas trahens ATCC 50062]
MAYTFSGPEPTTPVRRRRARDDYNPISGTYMYEEQEAAARAEEERKRRLRHEQLVAGSSKQGHHPAYNPLTATYAEDDLNRCDEEQAALREAAFAKAHQLKNKAERRGWDIISGEGDSGDAPKGRAHLPEPHAERGYNILRPTPPLSSVADGLPEYKRKNIALKFSSAVRLEENDELDSAARQAIIDETNPRGRASLYEKVNTREYNLLQIDEWAAAPPPATASPGSSVAAAAHSARLNYAHKNSANYDILAPSREYGAKY